MMKDFIIKVEPPLEADDGSTVPLSLEGLPVSKILSAHPEEYDTRYVIGNREFGYYPSSILTTLNDLHFEWREVVDRRSHTLTLSGYTVLDIEFEGEIVRFFDPLERTGGEREPIGGDFDAKLIEQTFYRAVTAVWSQVLATRD